MRYALDRNPCLTLVRQTPHIGGRGIAGPCESAANTLLFSQKADEAAAFGSFEEVLEATGSCGKLGEAAAGSFSCGEAESSRREKSTVSRKPPWSGPEAETERARCGKSAGLKLNRQNHVWNLAGRGLTEAEADLCQRFDPSATDAYDTPGFFIAMFEKSGD